MEANKQIHKKKEEALLVISPKCLSDWTISFSSQDKGHFCTTRIVSNQVGHITTSKRLVIRCMNFNNMHVFLVNTKNDSWYHSIKEWSFLARNEKAQGKEDRIENPLLNGRINVPQRKVLRQHCQPIKKKNVADHYQIRSSQYSSLQLYQLDLKIFQE